MHWLPLGTRNGDAVLAPATDEGLRLGLAASQRPFLCNFVGNARPFRMGKLVPSRQQLLQSLKQLPSVELVQLGRNSKGARLAANHSVSLRQGPHPPRAARGALPYTIISP